MEEIEEIKHIERGLEADVGRAREKSQKAIESYKAKMPGLVDAEKHKARSDAEERIGKAKAEGEKESLEIASAAEREIAALGKKGEKNFEKAVSAVILRFGVAEKKRQ